MSRDHLERVLNLATSEDIELGRAAYARYNFIVGRIATHTGFPLHVGAAVFSALSPNNDYLGNIRDARKMLEAASSGRKIDSFKVSTYGQNKRKAWAIAHGESPLKLIVANKTKNFYLNVLDPDDPYPVTIDGHMFNIWLNQIKPLQGLKVPKLRKAYHKVADDIRAIAKDVGMTANAVQATIWLVHKRVNSINYSGQVEFWERDYEAAGMGYEFLKL